MEIDNLDKKILQNLTAGVSSYQQLAKMCNITRNTLYRRIASLENRGIIKEPIGCIVNPDRLGIMPVIVGIVGIRASEADQEKILSSLSRIDEVRFLWQTYGDQDLVLVSFCQRGKEGEAIKKIRTVLDGLKFSQICVSIGFAWYKIDLSPFEHPQKGEKNVEDPSFKSMYVEP